jgi:hypothetical protein
MSKSWMIQGQVREKPRIGVLGEYNGEDVYSPNQPKRGQIDEMLMNLSHSDKVIIIGINPGFDDTMEEIVEEFKQTVLWGLGKR